MAQYLTEDKPFFREWKRRKPGEHRSLERAKLLADALRLDQLHVPVLTVVGSKGKGTTSIYASATLAAVEGLRVGTLTSPPIITNRERIRINGQAISADAYQKLSQRLSSILKNFSRRDIERGYLSPTGLFTLMGVRYMLDEGCDAIVLEAGMGGRSDEVSLIPASVVAVTSIFSEHVPILGKTVEEIAREKIGVVAKSTKAVLAIPQMERVINILHNETASRGCPLIIVEGTDGLPQNLHLPQGLSRANALLGIHAAHRLLDAHNIPRPHPSSLLQTTATIKTPGRLSLHQDRMGRTWIVDAAINASGIAATLGWVENHVGPTDTIFVSIPDGKDVEGARRALRDQRFIPVRIDAEHLSYTNQVWANDLISVEDIAHHIKGKIILAVGTWSFAGAILERLSVDYETAFTSHVNQS